MDKGGTRVIPFYTLVPPHALLLDIAGPLQVIRYANNEQNDVFSTAATSQHRKSSSPRSALAFAGLKHCLPPCRRMPFC
ncbi:AraC family transcriptional regulator [Agrobacterium tumefaciens]|nr:AraC family transcriptional regulator [Agrobacterium tumefaciens]